MRKPPPGMNNMPIKPGETKSQYMDRVRATKPTGAGGGRRSDMAPTPATSTTPRPKGGGTQGASKPIVGKPSGLSPIPPKPRYTPPKPTVTTPRPVRGFSKDPGTGAPPKPRRMKSGGMVKGKK